MPESANQRLDYLKVGGDVRVPGYHDALETAIFEYAIGDHAFENDPEEVMRGAVRLLSGYDVDPAFADDPERSLFALAVSDAWLSTGSIREKKSLLDVLKLVATGVKEDQYGTLSGKVRILSEQGIPRGSAFDPEATTGNAHQEYIDMIIKYIEKNTEETATQEVTTILAEWGEGSKLQHVRNKLGVDTQEDERPFRVIVLDKTAGQMVNDVGYTALYIRRPGQFTVVFNSDYQTSSDSLEHEYAHSQGDGMNRWYGLLLVRGVDEALTEGATSRPQTYPEQRQVLGKMLDIHPEYEELLYQAYVGHEGARKEAFSRIVHDFGLQGFLTLARLAPIDNPKLSGAIGESIYIPPNRAAELLGLNN